MTKLKPFDAQVLIHKFNVELGEIEVPDWEPSLTKSVTKQLRHEFIDPPNGPMTVRHLNKEAIRRFRIRWDPKQEAWILPIVGPSGETWGWQAKSPDQVRNYPLGIKKSRTLFGIDVLRNSNSVALVESPLDACYLDTLGIPAVASFGAAVSDRQMRLLIERVDEIVLALDNDKAGRREVMRILGEKWHHRIPMRVFDYGKVKGKDPGELTRKQVEHGMANAILAAFW